MRIWIIAIAIFAVWALVVALCSPVVGRYLANLARDNRL